jgi:hypothetical protein
MQIFRIRNKVGFIKKRHSRASGNPESARPLKELDSHFHGNDGKTDLRTFCEIFNIKYIKKSSNLYLRLSG